jgi:hypothetical protein
MKNPTKSVGLQNCSAIIIVSPNVFESIWVIPRFCGEVRVAQSFGFLCCVCFVCRIFHNASSLKQLTTCRYVAPLEHIISILVNPGVVVVAVVW